ncbi:hypothetical protein SAMN05421734_101373 [Pelagirhabdus alkalitolerans]|uniref:Spermine/spermidine synthase n=2 Tax=Pelagirhabdus alkalitolerans TaxID=1612202 RepID=A0A1G6GPV5_9BACI|nr:hypothetical protein SAMN05421734_101373 [Pelagirhabdus alkalitolerans]
MFASILIMKLRLTLTSKLEKMAHRFACVRWLFIGYYRLLTHLELRRVYSNQTGRVLCIGGGALPETACSIHYWTNNPVDVVDIDPKAIEQMEQYFSRYDVGGIQSILAEGSLIDIRHYKIIHVAKQVIPKEQVVDHIESQLKSDQVLIVRRCLIEKIHLSMRRVLKPC